MGNQLPPSAHRPDCYAHLLFSLLQRRCWFHHLSRWTPHEKGRRNKKAPAHCHGNRSVRAHPGGRGGSSFYQNKEGSQWRLDLTAASVTVQTQFGQRASIQGERGEATVSAPRPVLGSYELFHCDVIKDRTFFAFYYPATRTFRFSFRSIRLIACTLDRHTDLRMHQHCSSNSLLYSTTLTLTYTLMIFGTKCNEVFALFHRRVS